MADDHKARFDAMSIPELRRRVDLAVSHLSELRHALAMEAGMTLEGAPDPIPRLDPEQAARTIADVLEMLPLLRKPLTPAEAPAELGIEITHEQLVTLRESFDKSEMLGEVQRELAAYIDEVRTYVRAPWGACSSPASPLSCSMTSPAGSTSSPMSRRTPT